MAGDLNLKKSWNPKLVKNQTRVWEEEQAKLAELKKIRERNEELVKEEEYLNLLKLQHGEGFTREDLSKNEKLKLNKLNWMYDDVPHSGGVKNDAGFIERNDEFTEGKEKAESLLKGSQSFTARRNQTSDNIARIVSIGKETGGSKSFQDDPLLKIKSEQRRTIMKEPREKSHEDRHRSRHSRSKDGSKEDSRKRERSPRSSESRHDSKKSRHRHHDREHREHKRSDRNSEKSDVPEKPKPTPAMLY